MKKNSRLTLNKEVITSLNNNEMVQIIAGELSGGDCETAVVECNTYGHHSYANGGYCDTYADCMQDTTPGVGCENTQTGPNCDDNTGNCDSSPC